MAVKPQHYGCTAAVGGRVWVGNVRHSVEVQTVYESRRTEEASFWVGEVTTLTTPLSLRCVLLVCQSQAS